jgi:hypothetical protein
MAGQTSINLDMESFGRQCTALAAGFREVPPTLAKKSIKAAVRRGVKPFIPELRRATPIRQRAATKTAATKRDSRGRFETGSGKKTVVKPGTMRRNITTVVYFKNRNRLTTFTAKVGFARGPGKANHFHLIEAGTAERSSKATGASRGSVIERRFLRATFQRMAPQISEIIESELWVGLESAFKQLPKYLAAVAARKAGK